MRVHLEGKDEMLVITPDSAEELNGMMAWVRANSSALKLLEGHFVIEADAYVDDQPRSDIDAERETKQLLSRLLKKGGAG